MGTSILCFYGKLEREVLIAASKIFTTICSHQILNPARTSKVFSVFLCIGDVNLKLYQEISRQNSFYATFFYRESPESSEFVLDLNSVLSTYGPTTSPKIASVAVFDLDDTIITPERVIFYEKIFEDLELFREIFDYVVLWTHGTEDYLSAQLNNLKFKFDVLIARRRENDSPDIPNKGLAAVLRELNATYNVHEISYSILVDDKLSNFNNDYDLMLFVDRKPMDGFYRAAVDVIRQRVINSTNVGDRVIMASSIARVK
jgi:hypothetical protein